MEEMTNSAVVEGILSEINLKEVKYKKNGKDVEAIGGDIKVRVVMPIVRGGEPVSLEVPVTYFANKYTNAGNENSAYESLQDIMHNAKSISAVGEDEADCVRCTGARIRMNEYYDRSNTFRTFPRISGSWCNIISRADMEMTANAVLEVIITSMTMAVDKDGVEVDPPRLQIAGANVGYGDYTDIIPIISEVPEYIDAIKASYGEGDVIEVAVKLNFSSKTVIEYQEVEIGEPIERPKTVSVSDLIITGVKPSEMYSESYDKDEFKECLAKRLARIESLKTKKKDSSKTTEKRDRTLQQQKTDLGF